MLLLLLLLPLLLPLLLLPLLLLLLLQPFQLTTHPAGCHYYPPAPKNEVDCEHVAFHHCLRQWWKDRAPEADAVVIADVDSSVYWWEPFQLPARAWYGWRARARAGGKWG